jgi:hypothetical protein
MKKLDNFFNNTNLFVVFLITVVLSALVGWLIFIVLGNLLGTEPIPIKDCLMMALFMGVMCAMATTLLISMGRQSEIFWKQAKIVKEMVEQEETTSGLESIYHNEFEALKKLSSGRPPHTQELTKIYYILTTKHKYAK